MLIEHRGCHFFTQRLDETAEKKVRLTLIESGPDSPILEAFRFDGDSAISLIGFGKEVPLEIAQQFIDEARLALLPEAPVSPETSKKTTYLRSVFWAKPLK